MHLAGLGHLEAVRCLQYGRDSAAKTVALQLAVSHDHEKEIALALVKERDIMINSHVQFECMGQCVKEGHVIHWALWKGHSEVVQAILDHPSLDFEKMTCGFELIFNFLEYGWMPQHYLASTRF